MFRATGYHDEDKSATAPSDITLWRGGSRKARMAWTVDRARAAWFQHWYDHLSTGKLWRIAVGPDRLLAHYHQKHRHENEYVIAPTGMRPQGIRWAVRYPLRYIPWVGTRKGGPGVLRNRLYLQKFLSG